VLLLTTQPATALLYELSAFVFLALAASGATTAILMLYAWRRERSLQEIVFSAVTRPPRHSFSLILPARHEEKVLAQTVASIADLRHPAFEVIVVVGDDDPETHEVASRATASDRRFRVVVDRHEHKNKPRALNTALGHCRGQIVGVFDAEDQVAAQVLLAVDQSFQEDAVQIVQGATQLMNYHSSWFSVRNVLEYYFWFKSRLHYHGGVGFIPLGGNTVFIRRDWLLHAGGWDPHRRLGPRLAVAPPANEDRRVARRVAQARVPVARDSPPPRGEAHASGDGRRPHRRLRAPRRSEMVLGERVGDDGRRREAATRGGDMDRDPRQTRLVSPRRRLHLDRSRRPRLSPHPRGLVLRARLPSETADLLEDVRLRRAQQFHALQGVGPQRAPRGRAQP
jgi:hypothetical protein